MYFDILLIVFNFKINISLKSEKYIKKNNTEWKVEINKKFLANKHNLDFCKNENIVKLSL